MNGRINLKINLLLTAKALFWLIDKLDNRAGEMLG